MYLYIYTHNSSPGGPNNRFSVHIPVGLSSHNPHHTPLQSSLSYIPPSSSSPSGQHLPYYQAQPPPYSQIQPPPYSQAQPHPPPPPETIRVFLPEGQRTTVSLLHLHVHLQYVLLIIVRIYIYHIYTILLYVQLYMFTHA